MSKKFLTPVGLPTGVSNPSVGRTGDLFYRTDESAVYIYNGTIWEPLQGGGGGSYTISDTPPVDPNEGDVWFNSTEGATYIYYDAYWIEPVKNDAGPTGPAGVGIATGGTAGQILSKVDDTDYNTAWADLPPTTYVGDTAPSSPIDNQTWYQSSTGKTFIYYDSFWVEMLASTGAVGPAGSTGTTPSSYVSTAGGSLVTAASASTIPLRLQGATSQTANLLEVMSSDNIHGLKIVSGTYEATSNAVTTLGGGAIYHQRLADSGGLLIRRINGTLATPTQVLANERVGYVIGSSFDGTNFSNNAAVNFHAAENTTPTARGSYISFDTTNNGTSGRNEKMRLTDSGRLGIGTPTPGARLDVSGTNNVGSSAGNQANLINLFAGSGNGDYLEISNTRTVNGSNWESAGFRIQQKVDATYMSYIQFNGGNAGGISLGTGTSGAVLGPSEKLKIDSAGRVTMSAQPSFRAAVNTSQSYAVGWNKILATSEYHDTAANYSTVNSRFTAPVAGRYLFTAAVATSGMEGDGTTAFGINGDVSFSTSTSFTASGGNYQGPSISMVITLAANDYVEFYRYFAGAVTSRTAPWAGYFSGHLLG